MLSLIILKLPNLFLFVQRLGAGHPRKLCWGSPHQLWKLRSCFVPGSLTSEMPQGVRSLRGAGCGRGPGPTGSAKSLVRPQGHPPEETGCQSRASRSSKTGLASAQSTGGSSRSADAVKEWEECACSEDGSDRDPPPRAPVRAARARSRASPQLLPLGLSPRRRDGDGRCGAGRGSCCCLDCCPWPFCRFLLDFSISVPTSPPPLFFSVFLLAIPLVKSRK